VYWDCGLVRDDLQGNRGNLYGINTTSAALAKEFIKLDPHVVSECTPLVMSLIKVPVDGCAWYDIVLILV